MTVRSLLLLGVLHCIGCSCSPEISVGRDDDAAGLDGALTEAGHDTGADTGDPFAVPDATAPAEACAHYDHISLAMPDLADGQFVARRDGDRVLVIERPNNPLVGTGTQLRFHQSRGGAPFTLLADYSFENATGMVLESRFRDGAWDVLVERFAQDGLVSWMRVYDDGTVAVVEHPTPAGASGIRFRSLATVPTSSAFVELLVDDDGGPGQWIVELHEDASDELVALDLPSSARGRTQLLPRPSGELLVIVSNGIPHVGRVTLSPLTLPTTYTYLDGPWDVAIWSTVDVFDTAGGLVVGEIFRGMDVAGVRQPWRLRVRWLTEDLHTTALWSIETGTPGSLQIVGAPPTQEIFATLQDDPNDRNGTATIFHARASAPGVVSTPVPIGRTLAFLPPTVGIGTDGRAFLLHAFEIAETEVVCAESP